MHAKKIKQSWPYLIMAPALFHLLVFRVGPMFYTLFLSLKPEATAEQGSFPTLLNYQVLFTPRFAEVMFNSVYYILGCMLIIVPGSLLLALLLDKAFGQGIFRSVYFYPFTVVMVAVGIIWGYGFRPDGFVNRILEFLGVSGFNWLGGTGWLAMPALIVATSWRFVGYFTVIFLSGLQAIPQYLYDAAKVDGADAFQLFRHVTFPQLKPITLFVLVISSINLLRQFAIPKVMTEGGPFNKTNVLPLEIYQRAFRYFEINTAAAQSMVLIIIAIMLGITQFYVINRLGR